MKKIVFATNNENKIEEARAYFGDILEIVTLKDIGCDEDLPETQATFAGNALQKANYIYEKYKVDCFADDTGLEVDALDGDPGVFSARYAGVDKNSEANIQKLLENMKGVTDRNAKFSTVLALILNGNKHVFEGNIHGEILEEKQGEKGFGYDPVFKPYSSEVSFSEMTLEEKNKISHRGNALRKMEEFIRLKL